ncbi:hypothetical protein ACFVHW_04635 [Streptomyces sp. NPDC127110]|uniref:hypothetical protein n=1 Tax=Streptomyces sp. NPDC127110 TaxID=3345362 RepID=UPI003637AF9D
MTTPPTSGPERLRADRGLRAKTILNSYAPLFWFRHPLERHPRFGYLQIAHLGWRFAEPHAEFMPIFEAAARDAPRHVDWEFKGMRNWLILPTRLTEETRRNGDNFIHAQATVREDQEYCLAAARDMELILRRLAAASPNPGLLGGVTA